MSKKQIPRRLWDFGLACEAEILSRMSRGKDGRTGHEEVFGHTPNIAECLDFEFYDRVWWWDRGDKISSTEDPKRLGRWLGTSHRVGGNTCYWIIAESGNIVSKSTVQHVIKDDFLNPNVNLFQRRFERWHSVGIAGGSPSRCRGSRRKSKEFFMSVFI